MAIAILFPSGDHLTVNIFPFEGNPLTEIDLLFFKLLIVMPVYDLDLLLPLLLGLILTPASRSSGSDRSAIDGMLALSRIT